MPIQAFPNLRTVIDTGVSTYGGSHAPQARPDVDYAFTAIVDFGEDGDMATVTINAQEWVTSTSKIGVINIARADSNDYEDALLEGVVAVVCNVVDGVSFDVVAHAPEGTSGQYVLTIRGF